MRCSKTGTIMLLVVFTYIILFWLLIRDDKKVAIENDIEHFRNMNLGSVLEKINILVSPRRPCGIEETPIVVMVASKPSCVDRRNVIRKTYATELLTFFLLGKENSGTLKNVQDEAKKHNDIIIFDFIDHYQNMTIKTGLMMKWFLSECPKAQYMVKTDQDVFINPWTLKLIIQENKDAKLIGNKVSNVAVKRKHCKWMLPKWLYADDYVPEYLTGVGYVINSKYVKFIYEAAWHVPPINLEDIYYTYLIAYQYLNLSLTSDFRITVKRTFFHYNDCALWHLAMVHSMEPDEFESSWSKLRLILHKTMRNETVCSNFREMNLKILKWLLTNSIQNT